MALLDRPVPGGLAEVIGGVGALVETPLFFPGFSGRRLRAGEPGAQHRAALGVGFVYFAIAETAIRILRPAR